MLRPPPPHQLVRPPASPSSGSNTNELVWMLSFGSNMASRTLTGRRRVVPQRSLPAVVPGHALSFDMLGLPYAEPAFAVLQRMRRGGRDEQQPQPWWPAVRTRRGAAAAGDGMMASASPPLLLPPTRPPVAHGVLHLVTRDDWRRVLASEGVLGAAQEEELEDEEDEDGDDAKTKPGSARTFGYRVARVRCLAYAPCVRDLDSAPAAAAETLDHSHDHLPAVEALTLLSAREQHAAQGRRALPSKRYLSLLQQGAREHGLSPDYRRYLESLACYEPAAGGVARAGLLAAAGAAVAPALPLVAITGALGRSRGGGDYADWAQRALWAVHDYALAPVLGDGGAVVVGGGGEQEEGGGGGTGARGGSGGGGL